MRAIAADSSVEHLVLTAAEAHARKMPLCKRKLMPAGHEPGTTMRDARRVRKATMDGVTKLDGGAKPAAAAAAARYIEPDSPPPIAPDELLKFIIEDDD